MAGKQMGQNDRSGNRQQQQEANLGQKEARQDKKKESELSHMGEKTRDADKEQGS